MVGSIVCLMPFISPFCKSGYTLNNPASTGYRDVLNIKIGAEYVVSGL